MTNKKVVEKRARLDTPVEKLGKKETLMHYNAILIEELNAKMQLVLECVKASHEETGRRFVSLEEKFEQRFTALELALRVQKDDTDRRFASLEEKFEQRFTALELALRVQKDDTDRRFAKFEQRFDTLELGLRSLKDDMADMERRLSSKINRIAERCENHECRLGAIEARQ